MIPRKVSDGVLFRPYAGAGMVGGGSLLLLGVGWTDSPLGVALLLTGAGLLTWIIGGVLGPWVGPRRVVRVRYHAPHGGIACGPVLLALARAADCGVRIIWQRRAGALVLYLDVPVAVGDVLQQRIAALVPGGQAEPVVAVPPLAAGNLYRWAGAFPVEALTDPQYFIGDFELCGHLRGGGHLLVVQGTPGPAACCRPFWRWLWRWPAACATWRRGYPVLDRADELRWPLPATGQPATLRLDSHGGRQVPLPAEYTPTGEHPIVIGWAPPDERPVVLALSPALAGPILVLGSADARTQLLDRVVAQVQAGGGGSAVFTEDNVSDEDSAPERLNVDDQHLNLLAVAPVAGRPTPRAAEAAAVVAALHDAIPLLSLYLSWLGIASWLPMSGHQLVLDSARVWLLAHHRARLLGQPDPIPAPDLAGLVQALGDLQVVDELAAMEATQWQPGSMLGRVLAHAGADGQIALDTAGAVLTALRARWPPESLRARQIGARQVQTHLTNLLNHPLLSQSWADAVGPATAFAHYNVDWQIRIPRAAGSGRAVALYHLVNVLAAARARARRPDRAGPLFLALEDVAWPLAQAVIAEREHLRQAGVTLLVSSALLPTTTGRALLEEAAAWYVSGPAPQDVELLRAEIADVGADLPLAHLPPGTALVKVPGAQGPIIATITTTATDTGASAA